MVIQFFFVNYSNIRIGLTYDTFKFIFPDRKDKTAWLGETEDRKIGFFKSEHVQEQFSYDSLDGKCDKICPFFSEIR